MLERNAKLRQDKCARADWRILRAGVDKEGVNKTMHFCNLSQHDHLAFPPGLQKYAAHHNLAFVIPGIPKIQFYKQESVQLRKRSPVSPSALRKPIAQYLRASTPKLTRHESYLSFATTITLLYQTQCRASASSGRFLLLQRSHASQLKTTYRARRWQAHLRLLRVSMMPKALLRLVASRATTRAEPMDALDGLDSR